MKTASSALITLLDSDLRLVFADLYTFTLSGGTVLRYTSADITITLGGVTWARGPLLRRGKITNKIGMSVDALDLYVNSSRQADTINGVPVLQFLASGGLDGAYLLLERAYGASWSAGMTDKIYKFSGRINDVKVSRNEAAVTVQSDMELLNAKVPRNLYQSGCLNTLGDTACTVNRAALTVGGIVSGTPTKTQFGCNLGQAAKYFELGVVTFTSGQNAGVARTVRQWNSGLMTLIAPLPFVPAPGDTFTASPGCDKTQSTCTSRFNNVIHFRGMPYIPVPETVT